MIFVSRNKKKPRLYHYDIVKMILKDVTRDRLRLLASTCGIPRGRNKEDTLKNIMQNIDKLKVHYLAICITENRDEIYKQ